MQMIAEPASNLETAMVAARSKYPEATLRTARRILAAEPFIPADGSTFEQFARSAIRFANGIIRHHEEKGFLTISQAGRAKQQLKALQFRFLKRYNRAALRAMGDAQ